MPFNLRLSKPPSAANSPSEEKDDNDPTHPIFALHSTDTEERKLTLFQKMFSSSSETRNKDPVPPHSLNKRSSLVPPNYIPIFNKRHLPLTRPTSKHQWAEQLVSVPDNGIRTELSDMYKIFEYMEQRPLVLNSDDIDLFYEWFNTFLLIVEEIFLLEETCLFSWIEKTDELSPEDRKWEAPPHRITGELSESRRLKQKGNIMKLGREIRMYRQDFVGRPVLQGLPGLARLVELFVDELVAYLDLKKRVLPNCIKSRLNQKDRVRFEKHYWVTARKMEMPAYTVIASTRWMDRREIRRWKSKWFAGPGKGIYGKWKKTFNRKHYEIIDEFVRRVEESQLERETQVMMHEMARARMAEIPEEDYSEHESITRDSCASGWHNNSNIASMHAATAIQIC